VRVAIYVQAVLAAIQINWASTRKSQDSVERAVRSSAPTITSSIFITGCALITSAFVHARTEGLTIYHAMIVLNLSWLNNFTACFPLAASTLLHLSIEVRNPEEHRRTRRSLFKQLFPCLVHFTLMASFGLWVFSNPTRFDTTSPNCVDSTTFDFVGRDVLVTDRRFHNFWLTIYSISVIPVVNLVPFATAFVLPTVILVVIYLLIRYYDPCGSREGDALDGIFFGALALVIPPLVIRYVGIPLIISIMVGTELTIARNNVMPGEDQWTFGKILAILLLIFPFKDLWERIQSDPGERERRATDV
jgi:hypothetical protein